MLCFVYCVWSLFQLPRRRASEVCLTFATHRLLARTCASIWCFLSQVVSMVTPSHLTFRCWKMNCGGLAPSAGPRVSQFRWYGSNAYPQSPTEAHTATPASGVPQPVASPSPRPSASGVSPVRGPRHPIGSRKGGCGKFGWEGCLPHPHPLFYRGGWVRASLQWVSRLPGWVGRSMNQNIFKKKPGAGTPRGGIWTPQKLSISPWHHIPGSVKKMRSVVTDFVEDGVGGVVPLGVHGRVCLPPPSLHWMGASNVGMAVGLTPSHSADCMAKSSLFSCWKGIPCWDFFCKKKKKSNMQVKI